MEHIETNTEKEAHATENTPHTEHQEKSENSAALSREKTHTNESDEIHDKDYHLKKVNTLGVDIDNEFAVKGDDSDGKISWTTQQFIATVCLAGLYVGAQIPLYFVGGSLSFIAKDIGNASKISWLPVSNTLVLAAFAPYCGYMQDLFGRRYITLGGGMSILVGCVLLSTAHSFGQAIIGMCFAGAGAAIGELTALAGTAELVPVKHRGTYLAAVTFFVLPFVPYVMYSQLLSTYHTWRWGIYICIIYNGVFFIGAVLTYFPHSHTRAEGVTKSDILKRIDYGGGFFSITGVTLLLVALQSGGYDHPWSSAYVLCTLLIGIALIGVFIYWEARVAKYPMVPRELFAGQRIVATAYIVAFVAGMNFYSLLNFFPLEFSSLFPPDPVQVGLKGLGPGLSTTIGATLFNAALSWFPGHNRELLLVATVVMTAFGGALACVTPDTPRTLVALGTVCGFGVGGVLVPSATIAIIVTPDELIATAVALSLSIRVIGGSIGYTIYYNIFYNKLLHRLPEDIVAYAVAAGLPLSSATEFAEVYLTAPTNITTVKGVTPAVLEGAVVGTRWAYAYALSFVWYTSVAFGVCAIVACACLGQVRKYYTNRIAATIGH